MLDWPELVKVIWVSSRTSTQAQIRGTCGSDGGVVRQISKGLSIQVPLELNLLRYSQECEWTFMPQYCESIQGSLAIHVALHQHGDFGVKAM